MNKDLLLFILLGVLVIAAGAVLWFVMLADDDASFVPADETGIVEDTGERGGPSARREESPAVVPTARTTRPATRTESGAAEIEEGVADGPAMLAGQVTDPLGNPVPEALVTIFEDRSDVPAYALQGDFVAQTETAPDGSYSFEPPVHRNLMLRVDHLDWAMESRGGLLLEEGQRKRVDVRVKGGLPLAGEVLDQGGNPIPDARVLVVDQNVRALDPTTAVEREVVTDESGRFAFGSLTAGYKRVTASKEGMASDSRIGIILQPTRAPENVVLTLGPGHRITGKVVDGEGTPVPDVLISAEAIRRSSENIASSSYPSIKTAEDGTFVYDGLREGTYRLAANKFGYGAGARQNARTGDEPIVIELRRNPVIRGRVVDADTGEPVQRFRVVLARDENIVFAASQQTQYFEHENGEFTFENVAVTVPFFLFADAAGYAWGRSPLIDPPVAGDPRRGGPSGDVEGIEIRLDRGVTARGRIIDGAGKGVAGARVTLEPQPVSQGTEADMFLGMLRKSMRSASRTARTDADGQYLVENLHEGRFVVKATHPEFASGETDRDVPVSGSDEVRMPDLTLMKGGTIEGTVRDTAQRPAAGAAVAVMPRGGVFGGGGGDSYNVTADAQGRFTVAHVKPGIYQIRATSGDGDPSNLLGEILTRRQPTEVIVGDGETVRVTVE